MPRRRKTDGSGIIYCITNMANGHRYIGQTVFSELTRWGMHKSEAKCGSKYPLHQAMRKYTFDNFQIEKVITISAEVLASDPSVLDRLEIFFIKEFKTWTRWKAGYNATLGGKATGRGEANPNWGRKHSLEFRAMLSTRMSGKGNPNFGKPLSHSIRRCISLRFRGSRLSQDHRSKIAAARMSIDPSPKALAKRRWRKRTNVMLGKEILRCNCPHRFPIWIIAKDFIKCEACGLCIDMAITVPDHDKLQWQTHQR